ncbi:cell shape determining protein MreB [Spiroplasma helicoides]|uniref:Cell shape determining protein MreB n=1 Tax=Spiroplasma helicoides TaxID=216938 RepID=A0A1B3SMD6_9MOLU|nr:rod shape-determining protein [Spiroplasma helicoides]AOG61091.1 cell shape determining protein MreB [Spiroplasma helicoides]
MAKINLTQKKHVAIDIGTNKTKIHIEGLGMVFNQSTLMALDYKSKKVIALGDDAKKFVGKLSGTLQLKYPVRRGIITDLSVLKLFLKSILANYSNDIKDSVVTVACPTSLTQLERQSIVKAIKELGVYYVNTEDDVKLALIGAGADAYETTAFLCLDLGAGKSTAAIISSGETIQSRNSKVSGNSIDMDIAKFLKSKSQLMIGDITAEQIKNSIASLIKAKTPLKTTAYGYDLTTGMPKDFELSDEDISKIILSGFGNLTTLITNVLEGAPSEIAGDVIRNGLYVTGGVAKISGVKAFFEDFFEIPVILSKNCATATIDGAVAHKTRTFQKIELENDKYGSTFMFKSA